MYHAHEDLLKLSDKLGIYDGNWYDRLKYLLKVDPDKIKYKVHKRALKVLRPELFKYPKHWQRIVHSVVKTGYHSKIGKSIELQIPMQ